MGLFCAKVGVLCPLGGGGVKFTSVFDQDWEALPNYPLLGMLMHNVIWDQKVQKEMHFFPWYL